MNADVLQFEAIVSKTWGTEEELKQLKSDHATLDRKITAELAPKHDEKDGEEITTVDTHVQSVPNTDIPLDHSDNSSLVAEPQPHYQPATNHHTQPRPVYGSHQ